MTPWACVRTAVPLVAALSVLSCGGGTERPEPPSPPPIQTESAAEAARPARAEDRPAAEEIGPRPVPAMEPVDGGVVAPTPAARIEPAQPAEPAKPVAIEPAPPDPLQWMEDRKAREEADRVRLAAAEKAVEDAKTRVAELESRLLAVKNPFLPRPVLPPEEAAAWEGLDGVGRAKRVEEQLVEARADLDRAEKALAAIRSR